MASTNDKLEQQKSHTRELTDEELDQTTGGVGNTGSSMHIHPTQDPSFHEIPSEQGGQGTIEIGVLEV